MEEQKMFESVYADGDNAEGKNRGIIKFDYQKANGDVETRTVFVVSEDADYYRGLDFKYLDDDAKFRVHQLLSSKKVTTLDFKKANQAQPIEGFEDCWKKAWRTYKKSGIVGEVTTVEAPSSPKDKVKSEMKQFIEGIFNSYPKMTKDEFKVLFNEAFDSVEK